MAFGDLKTEAGLQALNSHLEDKSYIEGYLPTQADTTVFDSMNGSPCESLPHALRWYNHIVSYGSERTSFPSVEGKADPVTNGVSKDDDEDDDVDLFGSSSEEEEDDEEAARIKQERIDAYNAKKSKKAVVQAKSTILLDVKPWDDETDMLEVEKMVRTIVADGLLWGQAKLVPLAYGIKKLQIGCVVHDDKIGTDFLEEEITKFSDYVQSVDVAAFNKI